MTTSKRLLIASAGVMSLLSVAAQARDASPPVSQTSAHAIPNPYAEPSHANSAPAAPSGGDRAADAYSMGFAIGLGAALINKQRDDEAKRLQPPQPSR